MPKTNLTPKSNPTAKKREAIQISKHYTTNVRFEETTVRTPCSFRFQVGDASTFDKQGNFNCSAQSIFDHPLDFFYYKVLNARTRKTCEKEKWFGKLKIEHLPWEPLATFTTYDVVGHSPRFTVVEKTFAEQKPLVNDKVSVRYKMNKMDCRLRCRADAEEEEYKFFPGVVRQTNKGNRYLVHFEDGSEEWIHLPPKQQGETWDFL